MEQIEPWFYPQFRCIAHLCDDTCCAGWEIYIDDCSLERYRNDHSDFGQYRQSKITETQDGATFSLVEHRRCPFLNEENLCTMILEDGEDSLCDICADHPRFFNSYDGYEERGIGLCCPEGSRLLLSEPLRFLQHHVEDDTPSDSTAEALFDLRGLLLEILTDRELSLSDRCTEALQLAEQAQCQLYGEELSQKDSPVTKEILWQTLLRQMMALEPINEQWQDYLEVMNQQLPALLAGDKNFRNSPQCDPHQYGDIASYILFRHFPDALWDGAIVARLTFALLSTLFVYLCHLQSWLNQGTLSQEDSVRHLKNWSKQVEYSDENTQQFLLACQVDKKLQLCKFQSLDSSFSQEYDDKKECFQ